MEKEIREKGKLKTMKYLLVKEKGKRKYTLYCPDTFGVETWGSGSYQTELKKKRKYWYIETWNYGGEWLEDEITETKLNVVIETSDLDDIIHYVAKYNEKEIEHIYIKTLENSTMNI